MDRNELPQQGLLRVSTDSGLNSLPRSTFVTADWDALDAEADWLDEHHDGRQAMAAEVVEEVEVHATPGARALVWRTGRLMPLRPDLLHRSRCKNGLLWRAWWRYGTLPVVALPFGYHFDSPRQMWRWVCFIRGEHSWDHSDCAICAAPLAPDVPRG